MESNEDKVDALVQRVIGDDLQQMQGYRNRIELRDVLGDQVAREIILEPKQR